MVTAMRFALFTLFLSFTSVHAMATSGPCEQGVVWEDRDGNGQLDSGEKPLPGVKISDGVNLVLTDADGTYRLPYVDGRTIFVIKPAGYDLPSRADGLPDAWLNVRSSPGPALKFGGMPVSASTCRDFGLRPAKPSPNRQKRMDVVVLADPQTKSMRDVDYFQRDIIDSLKRDTAIDMGHSFGDYYFDGLAGDLGLSLGDIVDDDLSLYPEVKAATTGLVVPWLHVAGNHDLDFDAASDEDSLLTFRHHFGPDTYAWEESEAIFLMLDDVIYQPGKKPAYIGGLREDQFTFLETYLPTVPKDRLLVLGVHIPLFDAKPDVETFRRADRARLFALLQEFPHVLLLSGHDHTQRHVRHGAGTDWHGATPLHEYSVGAASGAYWSGVKDAAGIPDSTMADGTPNGYARLQVLAGGEYRLAWHPARDAKTALALHAPRVLRQGAYPAWGVFANVFMGEADTRVEYRVDGSEWRPMKFVVQLDPRLLVENVADDLADALRGFDRSPEATPSLHLWRGALPTDLPQGEHTVDVRVQDRWRGEQLARTKYRLEAAEE
jgi:hypothetical protein